MRHVFRFEHRRCFLSNLEQVLLFSDNYSICKISNQFGSKQMTWYNRLLEEIDYGKTYLFGYTFRGIFLIVQCAHTHTWSSATSCTLHVSTILNRVILFRSASPLFALFLKQTLASHTHTHTHTSIPPCSSSSFSPRPSCCLLNDQTDVEQAAKKREMFLFEDLRTD
jgi:hypothetical protein